MAASATKYANVPFQVRGRIVDRDTKKPVANVQVLIFTNGSHLASNNGWAGAHDAPNLPRTDSSGRFLGRTRLYREGPEISIDYIEIITLRAGYRTERFRRDKPPVHLTKDKSSGVIEIDNIEIMRTQTD